MSTSLDIFDCPLTGTNLIEASAGTGKTWNICGLYIRLLIEARLAVRDILVVTFTKAATAELQGRIRTRISELHDALASATSPTHAPTHTIVRAPISNDPFICTYVARILEGMLPGVDAAQALRDLTHALHGFDESAIFTIHAFCQRALSEVPFSAGLPFEFEALESDDELVETLAVDFYRQHVVGDAQLVAYASALRKELPIATLVDLMRHRLRHPLDQLIFNFPDEAESCEPDALHTAFQQAATLWQGDRETICKVLLDHSAGLNKASYKDNAWNDLFELADHFFRQPLAAIDKEHEKLTRLSADRLKKGTRKNQATPEHLFFDAMQHLVDAGTAFDKQLDIHKLRLIQTWLKTGPAELRQRKLRNKVIAFDDMLLNLHGALCDERSRWLASKLRQRYPAALIDEFQDTDRLQFDIFSRIYQAPETAADTTGQDGHTEPAVPYDRATRPPSLYLVGDPKQAIYAFRGADLHTYLGATRSSDARRFHLSINQRSVSPYIEALNGIFTRNSRAFVLDEIDYHAVSAGTRPKPALLAHQPLPDLPALNLWMMPDTPGTVEASETLATQITTQEIVRLLTAAREGRLKLGERALEAGDIAVIVRNHKQGQMIHDALRQHGIASAQRARHCVWDSSEARVMALFIAALADPARDTLRNAALASPLFACDAHTLDQHNLHDIKELDQLHNTYEVERLGQFEHYRHLALTRGFASVWRKVLNDGQLPRRLLAQVRGERALTNYLHLAELMDSEARQHTGLTALAQRVRQLMAAPSLQDNAELRLESDDRLVQIVTVHAAKGLEYPVTFCPFLWSNDFKERANQRLFTHYHDASGTAVTHFGEESESGRLHARRERFAESLRTVYVALTRAVNRCYLVVGNIPDRNKPQPNNTLNWLVAGNGFDVDAWVDATDPEALAADCQAAWRELAEAHPQAISLTVLEADSPDERSNFYNLSNQGVSMQATQQRAWGKARIAQRALAPTWSVSSFTSLTRFAKHAPIQMTTSASLQAANPETDGGGLPYSPQVEAPARDHDEFAPELDEVANFGDEDHEQLNKSQDEPGYTPAQGTTWALTGMLDYPRGAEAGILLHEVFQRADFSHPASWDDAIANGVRRHPLLKQIQGRRDISQLLHEGLKQVAHAALDSHGLKLSDVAHHERLDELEFTLPTQNVTIIELRNILESSGIALPPISETRLQGYMRGAIDCVFRHAGRFYLADWKSNWLGSVQAAYNEPALQQAMHAAHYELQASLYTLALHRYLRHRITDYRYERDFGGVFYVFVRGIQPGWIQADGRSSGIWQGRLDESTVSALDLLFAGIAHLEAA